MAVILVGRFFFYVFTWQNKKLAKMIKIHEIQRSGSTALVCCEMKQTWYRCAFPVTWEHICPLFVPQGLRDTCAVNPASWLPEAPDKTRAPGQILGVSLCPPHIPTSQVINKPPSNQNSWQCKRLRPLPSLQRFSQLRLKTSSPAHRPPTPSRPLPLRGGHTLPVECYPFSNTRSFWV